MEKKHLTLQDRQSIEQMLNAKKNFVEIALALDKNKSTISREVRAHAERIRIWTSIPILSILDMK